MAWQNFRYCSLHAARDAGAAAISAQNAWSGSQPKDFLIDDRAGSLASFAAAATDHYIQIDRGAATPEAIDRLIIPFDHNYNGENIRVRAADDAAFTTGVTTILATVAITSTAQIDKALTSNTQRYVRIDWPTSTSTAWATPQLFLTRTREPTIGPEPGWTDLLRHNTLDFQKESGAIASLSLGADRRFFEVVYRNVDASADLTLFSDLLAEVGTSKPFYLDPPFDTETVIWMKLTEDSRQVQDPAISAATTAPQKQITLAMLEHLA